MLAPADPSKVALLKHLKMRIAHRFPNGDLMAVYSRESTSNLQGKMLEIRARIPYLVTTEDRELTTEDLTEIHYVESHHGEVFDRSSGSWEDEYTLKLSGFTEAKSKVASNIESKRKKLIEFRDKLRRRLEAFGKERRKVTKTRSQNAKDKALMKDKVQELNNKISERDATISSQKDELEAKDKQIQEMSRAPAGAGAGAGARN